jgi:uncharacterized protein YjbJ (UPF0337 family)
VHDIAEGVADQDDVAMPVDQRRGRLNVSRRVSAPLQRMNTAHGAAMRMGYAWFDAVLVFASVQRAVSDLEKNADPLAILQPAAPTYSHILLFLRMFRSGTALAPDALRSGEYRRNTMRGYEMNWDRVEGNWKQFSGKVKEKWGKLTDDSLTQINGKRDQLIGRVQESYGISRDEADRQVSDWERTL